MFTVKSGNFKLISGLFLLLSCIPASAQKIYDITKYGAVGDGIMNDAAAIQNAIDRCSLAGGGRVIVPAGNTFRAGPIELKQNVELHLQHSAILIASDDPEHYRRKKYFLYADKADNLSITGLGTIDGNGHSWMKELEGDIFRPKPDRPGLIQLLECDRLTIKGITIKNAPAWTVHLIGCVDVLIEGIRILNDLRIPNCDGIDPNHCRNVRIANCHIVAGDDCIVPKNTKEYVNFGPTENITVTGCTLSSSSCAIKIGTESVSDFRNMVFDSCVITASNRGLGIQLRDGGTVENIIFSNIVIETSHHGPRWWGKAEPIYVTAIPRTDLTSLGKIRNIRFTNIICRSENGVFVHGWEGGHIEDITFDNVKVELDKWTDPPGGEYDTRPGIGRGVYESKIAGFFCKDAEGVTFRNCKATWGDNPQDYFGRALYTENTPGMVLQNFIDDAVDKPSAKQSRLNSY